MTLQERERLIGVVRLQNVITALFQVLADSHADQGLVFDQQNRIGHMPPNGDYSI